ncbi:MAG TPA: endonuclease VIII [Erysipelotrichaceae bacterium]|nr:endonuclease VIII [Erysipelotrichaceae bacterium]
MIELPESMVVSKQIRQCLVGKKIEKVILNASPHKFAFFSMDADRYPMLLEGKTVRNSGSFGGQIEVEIDDMQLYFSDGASPRYFAPKETLPLKHQMMIRFDDQSAITVTIAMYGMMYLYPKGENKNPYTIIAKEKPSPLNDAFTFDYFNELIASCPPTMSIKGMLATEQRIPGLGNGCLQDILFHAKLHPKRKHETLNETHFRQLYDAIKETLQNMVDRGGRATEKDLFGKEGGYVPTLYAKTVGTSCPACSATILKEPYLGGSITFCPRCQK